MTEQENPALPSPGYLAGPTQTEPPPDRPFLLLREALLLNPQASRAVAESATPIARGGIALLWVLGTIVVVRLLGGLLGFLTTPRIDLIQQALYSRLLESGWYANQVAQTADFAQQFQQAYFALWQGVRMLGGYPSSSGLVISIVVAVIGTLIGWLLYSLLAHGIARWLGGQATLRQGMGVLALAYAPMLLLIVEFIPGATVAASLVFLLTFMTKFTALKTTYKLTSGYALTATFAPYVIGLVILLAVLIFGGAYGISQIPYIDQILRTLRTVGAM